MRRVLLSFVFVKKNARLMYARILLTLFILTLIAGAAPAQEIWSLQRCIQYAQQNNLSIKQSQYGIQNAKLTEKQNKFSRLPNVSANGSYGQTFGRTIDPTTNSFVEQSFGFNSYSVNFGLTVFGGNQINNSIKQSRFDVQAAEMELGASANTLALNVARAYLSILLAQEQLENARQRLAQSEQQLDQTDRFIRAGNLPEVERLAILAQIAADEQSIIEAENSVAINYLNLRQLMEFDPVAEDIRIERPGAINIPTDRNPDILSLNALYTAALGTQPQVEASLLRVESARLGVNIAKAGFLPNLSIGGNLNSNYSTRGQRVLDFRTDRLSQEVFINGTPFLFEVEQQVPRLGDNPFFEQINQNFGQQIFINLRIPIYSNHSNIITMERARLGVLNQEVNNRQVLQQLKTDVQRAIADARAARRLYEAAQRSVQAARLSFENAQKRYDLGAANSLELFTARNALDRAEVDLVSAKYQYFFNLKVIDFYEGRPLTLD